MSAPILDRTKIEMEYGFVESDGNAIHEAYRVNRYLKVPEKIGRYSSVEEAIAAVKEEASRWVLPL